MGGALFLAGSRQGVRDCSIVVQLIVSIFNKASQRLRPQAEKPCLLSAICLFVGSTVTIPANLSLNIPVASYLLLA